MKNVLMTTAVLLMLLTGSAVAQRYDRPTYPPQPRYGNPGYNQPNYNYDYDDYQFDRHLDWWDQELNLSRRQEREIRRIRQNFDQQARSINVRDPRQRDSYRRLRQREFFDMMAVLNSAQRDRVIEHMRPYERVADRQNGRGWNNGRGRGYDPYGY